MDGYFVDIGIPDDYASAGVELPKRLHRPAIILKPDGVLIQNRGLADSANGFCWLEGAKDAVRTITDFGFHAFIVTDRAAASFDHPTENDVTALHRRMIGELRNAGGTIDDLRFYSIHSGAEALAGLEAPNRREAAAAAIIDLTLKWEVEGARSFFIDATATELNVAAGAVVPGYHFSGGNLNAFVSRHLTYR
jgi:D-glycero-D-manno-heptose 1,7-bisphosphate phosphatase